MDKKKRTIIFLIVTILLLSSCYPNNINESILIDLNEEKLIEDSLFMQTKENIFFEIPATDSTSNLVNCLSNTVDVFRCLKILGIPNDNGINEFLNKIDVSSLINTEYYDVQLLSLYIQLCDLSEYEIEDKNRKLIINHLNNLIKNDVIYRSEKDKTNNYTLDNSIYLNTLIQASTIFKSLNFNHDFMQKTCKALERQLLNSKYVSNTIYILDTYFEISTLFNFDTIEFPLEDVERLMYNTDNIFDLRSISSVLNYNNENQYNNSIFNELRYYENGVLYTITKNDELSSIEANLAAFNIYDNLGINYTGTDIFLEYINKFKLFDNTYYFISYEPNFISTYYAITLLDRFCKYKIEKPKYDINEIDLNNISVEVFYYLMLNNRDKSSKLKNEYRIIFDTILKKMDFIQTLIPIDVLQLVIKAAYEYNYDFDIQTIDRIKEYIRYVENEYETMGANKEYELIKDSIKFKIYYYIGLELEANELDILSNNFNDNYFYFEEPLIISSYVLSVFDLYDYYSKVDNAVRQSIVDLSARNRYKQFYSYSELHYPTFQSTYEILSILEYLRMLNYPVN